MDILAQFALLTEAGQVAIAGGALWALAAVAAVMERRRVRARSLMRLEQVGWVPWTALFVLAAMLGAGLLAMSLPVVLKG